MSQKQLTHTVLKPFLKEGVTMRFKQHRDGWQDIFLEQGGKCVVITATGDENGYFQFDNKVPDWASAKAKAVDSLPTVPPVGDRVFYMRNGKMVGPIVSDAHWHSDKKGDFTFDEDDQDYRWLDDGKFVQMYETNEPHEFDLVEMVQSKIFG